MPPVKRRTVPLARTTAVVALTAASLVLTGCGGGSPQAAKKPPKHSASPSPSVSAPAGVTLTDPGTKLRLGQPATVGYQPNDKRRTVLELTPTSVHKVPMRTFRAYKLDQNALSSNAYFVQVAVKNVGDGEVGRTDVPLWLVDDQNTLVHASAFSNDFKACPSTALPERFGAGRRTKACLVYLVPQHGAMEALSFRPDQKVAGITWTGKVQHGLPKKISKKHARKHS